MNDILLKYALRYAAQGQPVFPCYELSDPDNEAQRAKAPRTSQGFKNATTDASTIASWWTRTPHAAIGLPTGIKFDVLDVDHKPGGVNGYAALADLREAGVLSGSFKVVSTPTGGVHYYFPTKGDVRNAAYGAKGIDVRGLGGYVIGAPSVLYALEDGLASEVGRYTVEKERHVALGAPLDAALVRSMMKPAPTRHRVRRVGVGQGIEGITVWLSGIKEGDRNHALFWAACESIRSGYDPYELTDTALSIGLEPYEVDGTIRSALRTEG